MDSFFFFVDLGSYRSRNVPVYVYEDQLQSYPSGDIFEANDPLSAAYATFSDGNYYQSLLHFDRAIAEDRDNGLLYLARAQARIAIGDYRLAYDDLIEGMDRVPEWADVDFNVAEIYSNVDDLHDQIEALETWTQRRPADHRAHFVLGYLQYFLANYDAAKDALILALAGEPEHQHARALLDRTLQAQALQDAPEQTLESPPAPEKPAVTVE